jgi:integrase
MKAPTTRTPPPSRNPIEPPDVPPAPSPPSDQPGKPARRRPLSGAKKPQPKPLAGSVQVHGGWYTLRVRVGDRQPRFKLGKVDEMSEAKANEKAAAWLERMAREGRSAAPTTPAGVTVKAHFEAWISGDLFRKYGAVNGLKIKASADDDRARARCYIYPEIGKKLVVHVTEEDIDRVMGRVPPERRAGTRARIHSLLHRGFDLAIAPARLRKDNPVTRYHKPAKDPLKLFAYLFPSELLALLACRAVPLGRRVLYALAIYTGLRKSSLLALTRKAVDLDNRTLLSRVSKTGIAQLFEIPPSLVWVLRGWYRVAPTSDPAAKILTALDLGLREGRHQEAEALRADLRAAGITREMLFAKGPNVEPLRFHDMRGTFVTWAKRAGKGDGWISDRTGHLTPEMIQRYTRAARTLEDLRIDPFRSWPERSPSWWRFFLPGVGPMGAARAPRVLLRQRPRAGRPTSPALARRVPNHVPTRT